VYVSQISLVDFRSYTQLDLALEPGVSAFVGPNGHGKTNLIEAIAYAASLSSHRVTSDVALVRSGARRAIVRVVAVRAGRSTLVELEINPGQANRAQVNRSPVRRSRDILGILRTVVFAPEDLSLVKGDPEGRRRFLDQLLVQVTPRMAGVLADYERVLRQRGALLKSAGYAGRGASRAAGGEGVGEGGPADLRTLDVWDAKLAQLGAQVLAARTRLVEQLRPHVELAYEQVSDGGEAAIGYRSSLQGRFDETTGPMDGTPAEVASGDTAIEIPHLGVPVETLEAELVSEMGRLRRKEIERGVTLVGPHRDDVVLQIAGLPARGYASHGESWSLTLALRLASYHLLTHGIEGADGIAGWVEGSEPVLVLDDVFAELDTDRRGRLANLVKGAEQVLITAAAANDVPEELVGSRFDVTGGQVNRVR
jgi:DNA replication and repair protein RecF